MIYEGKEGSLTFFFNDKLVCSSPLHYKTSLEDHYNQAYRLLVEGFEQGRKLQDMIVHMWMLFDQHYYFNMDGSITYSN